MSRFPLIDTIFLIFVCRYTKFREIRNDMGLLRTRQQSHTIESIREAMIELRKAYPNAGAREMVILLFHEKEMSVSRYLICLTLICI